MSNTDPLRRMLAAVQKTADVLTNVRDAVTSFSDGVLQFVDDIETVLGHLIDESESVPAETEDEEVHFETEEVFSTEPEPTEREKKIEEIRDFLCSVGTYTGEWFSNDKVATMTDKAVEAAWTLVSDKVGARERMDRVLKEELRGDRFGRIDARTKDRSLDDSGTYPNW